MKRIISVVVITLVSGCSSTSSDNWTYSEKANHFEKSVFIESAYDDKTENSGLLISCDKGGENEIFAKFVAAKNESHLLFPDHGVATFDFVIDGLLSERVSGFYIYKNEQKIFFGMSNKLPNFLLNKMGAPSLSRETLHVRMTIEGVHINALKKALDSNDNLKTNEAILKWIRDNSTTHGIQHYFEKHVELKGFNKHIESYNGCSVSKK